MPIIMSTPSVVTLLFELKTTTVASASITRAIYAVIQELAVDKLYDPNLFSDLLFDTLNRYQQRHDSLNSHDFTAGFYAAMTPKKELNKIQEQVGVEMLQPETNRFCMNDTPLEHEGHIYGKLVAAQHKEQRNRYMDDLALQIRQMQLPSLFATLKRGSLPICNLLLLKN